MANIKSVYLEVGLKGREVSEGPKLKKPKTVKMVFYKMAIFNRRKKSRTKCCPVEGCFMLISPGSLEHHYHENKRLL